MVGQDTEHPHRMGAELLGYSVNPKGHKGKLYEWEHAMPATRAYLYLLNAAADKALDFTSSYVLVSENFKLIALDGAQDLKLKNAKRATSMGKNWSILTDSWLDRYFDIEVAKIRGGIDPSTITHLSGKNFADQYNIANVGKVVEQNKLAENKADQALTYLASGQIPQNSNSYTALNNKKSELVAFRNQSIIGLLVVVILGLLVF